jgi:hypothetical protein
MWNDGEPIDLSPTIDQAINGGFPWLEIKTPNDVDLAALKHPPTTFVHDVASRLRCASAPIQDGARRRPCSSLPGSRATPSRSLGCDYSRNHRPSFIPTM